jgi:steroid 5-alpha reductase family enzyme
MILVSLVAAALGLSAAMAVAWYVQMRQRNGGWSDVFWSYATGLGGAFLALVSWSDASLSPRQWLVAALVVAWSLRLGTHILDRTLHAANEDARYAQFRSVWKDSFQPRMFWFLQIQALAAFVLVVSVGLAAHNPAPGLRPTDAMGAMLLIGAILGEGLADRQLKQFAAKASNKGRICDEGLWAWSRHPNYFFEWLGWLAYPVIAYNPAYQVGLVALIGPAFMFVLLRYVSGVPPLEEHMVRKHGGNFVAYQERVAAFFPAPPRRSST